jgi:hypothetical protein
MASHQHSRRRLKLITLLLRAVVPVVLKVTEQPAVVVLEVIEHLMELLAAAGVPSLYLHLRLQPITQ